MAARQRITRKQVTSGRKLSESEYYTCWSATRNDRRYRLYVFKETENIEQLYQVVGSLNKCRHHKAVLFGISGYGIEKGEFYILSPYKQWQSLRQLLSKGSLETKKALAIASSLLTHLDLLHNCGLDTNRLLPEDIFITRSNQVVIFPFNPQTVIFLPDLAGTVKATVSDYYVAPETIRFQIHDAASQYYAIGAIIYEMLFGFVPFYDEARADVYRHHLHSQLQFPVRRQGRDEKVLVAASARLLSKKPDERLRSLAAVREAFGAALGVAVGLTWEVRPEQIENNPSVSVATDVEQMTALVSRFELALESLRFGNGQALQIENNRHPDTAIFQANLQIICARQEVNFVSFCLNRALTIPWHGLFEIVAHLLDVARRNDSEFYQRLISLNPSMQLFATPGAGVELVNIQLHWTTDLHDFFILFASRAPFVLHIGNWQQLDFNSQRFFIGLFSSEKSPALLMLYFGGEKQSFFEQIEIAPPEPRSVRQRIGQLLSIDSEKALLIYNRIIAKGISHLWTLPFYLELFQRQVEPQVPATLAALLQEIILHLPEGERALLLHLRNWVEPMPLSLLEKDMAAPLRGLLDKGFVHVCEHLGRPGIVFSSADIVSHLPHIEVAANELGEIQEKWYRQVLPERPLWWLDVVPFITRLGRRDIPVFMRAVNLLRALRQDLVAIKLLDALLQQHPKFANHNQLLHTYEAIYYSMGSYDVALSYLDRLIVRDQNENFHIALRRLDILIRLDRLDEARALLRELQKVHGSDPRKRAALYFHSGQLFNRHCLHADAAQQLAEAETLFRQLGEEENLLEVLCEKIMLFENKGEIDKGITLCQSTIDQFSHLAQAKRIAWLRKKLGDLAYRHGNVLLAAATYQDVLAGPQVHLDNGEYFEVSFNQAMLEWLIGDNRGALETLNKIAEEIDHQEFPELLRRLNGSMAALYREVGDYGKALRLEHELLDLAKKELATDHMLISLNNLGQLLVDINQVDRAQSILQESLAVASRIPQNSEAIHTHLSFISLYVKQGRIEKGAEHLAEARLLASNSDNHQKMADLHYYQALLSYSVDDLNDAERHISAFMQIPRLSFRHRALACLLRGQVQLRRGHLEDAHAACEKSSNLARMAGLYPVMLKLFVLRGDIAKEECEEGAFLSAYRQANFVLLQIADSFLSSRDRQLYLEALEFEGVLAVAEKQNRDW
jgi:serine/threonine protein kinase/tetratricopeptide (TPR) repeat protein